MSLNKETTDYSSSYSSRRVISAHMFTGSRVRNRMNEELGSIKDIMIDFRSGRVAYLALAYGGFLGIGEKLFAIPWQAMVLDEDRQCFILDADRSYFENAPGFDKNHWPEVPDPRWSSRGPEDEPYREYSRNLKEFAASVEVEQKAAEAERALNSTEGPELRRAEQIGKQRSKISGEER